MRVMKPRHSGDIWKTTDEGQSPVGPVIGLWPILCRK